MDKLYTSREIDMGKVVLAMGYKSYVMDAKDGVALMDVLAKAEVYEEKYHSAEGDNPSHYTYHVYPLDEKAGITMRLISDEVYGMYKLAGRPA
jgi:hypothetical protein